MDRVLVERARGGDRDAFADLIQQFGDSLFAIAFRILRDSGLAEDAVQDTLISAWRQLPRLRDTGRFEAWIRRVLVHACYAESRRGRDARSNIRLLDLHGSSTSDGSRALADRDEIERAFRHLPLDQRSVFVLHHYVGLPLIEVAETLGIPAGTARSRLHYATRFLRSAMTPGAVLPIEEGRLA